MRPKRQGGAAFRRPRLLWDGGTVEGRGSGLEMMKPKEIEVPGLEKGPARPEKKPWERPDFLSRELLESIAGLCTPGNGKTAFDGTPACNLNPNS